ncbi:MAG: YicC/YloC family endoribonuclease [Deltaproteobacteria bacterium]
MGVKGRAMESMTGFGAGEVSVRFWGKVSCEIRSTNHKFLEIILHLPDGYLSLEERVKNEIESRLKRGRAVCVVTVIGSLTSEVNVNESMVDSYIRAAHRINKRLGNGGEISVDTLMNLPGVLCTSENKIAPTKLWPTLGKALDGALDNLHAMRVKEGKRLVAHLNELIVGLGRDLEFVRDRFKKSIAERLPLLKTDIEKTAWLKESDITEEIERLAFHIGNFKAKLRGNGPAGKEMDFICQEMQREANTMGAKSADVKISGKVVQIKSDIEKLREQVQNLE